MTTKPKVTAIAQWFGTARMIGEHVGEALQDCEWVGIPFCGGCCEVPYIEARTIQCNDLHRHLYCLCRVIANEKGFRQLASELQCRLFHPDMLEHAQEYCKLAECEPARMKDPIEWAANYFICCWMTRAGTAGTPSEFTAGVSTRWDAGGGDSNRRFRNAISSIEDWHKILVDRVNFTCLEWFEFLKKCKDKRKHGIYVDAPFLGTGKKYTHNFGATEDDQKELYRLLEKFKQARMVVRAYDTPFIRSLYIYDGWEFREITGRKQTNAEAPEVLIVRG